LKVCFQSQQLAVFKLFAWPTSGNDLKIMNFRVITEQTASAPTQNQIPFHHFRQQNVYSRNYTLCYWRGKIYNHNIQLRNDSDDSGRYKVEVVRLNTWIMFVGRGLTVDRLSVLRCYLAHINLFQN